MYGFSNLDLITLGSTVAAIGILGFMVFFSKPRSATHRSFLCFTLATIAWGVTNYLSYKIIRVDIAFQVLRLALFFAVLHALSFSVLFFVFPNETVPPSRFARYVVLPLAILTALLTLTPLVLKRVGELSTGGHIASAVNGPGIIIFGIAVSFLVGSGIYFLIRGIVHSQGEEKHRFLLIATGAIVSFVLIIIFNFIFPAFRNNARFISLGASFFFPLIIALFYSISRHHLFNIKVLSTEVLTFVLAVVSLVEVVLAEGIALVIFRSGVFILILGFGILLIKSVQREVRQREELQKLTTELQRLNTKLQEADRMKSQFLSFASHQVKSPMTVVKDYASLIMDGTYGPVPDKVKETAQKIKDSANRLIALVINLLDLRRLEEGKIEYNFEEINLFELVKSVVDEMQTLTKEKNLTLTLDTPQSEIKVKADKEKLRQVFQNLLDNSVKYTETGWIKVELQATSSKIQVVVSDSGMGIPADVLPLLFEQFVRSSGETKKIQGTGLGLYIAKQFMKAHGGDISATSPGPGKGSTFTVELRQR